jgi:hypothetical protein
MNQPNLLEILKSKLKKKPVVKEKTNIEINIFNDKPLKTSVAILDERSKNYDRSEFENRIKESKLGIISHIETEAEKEAKKEVRKQIKLQKEEKNKEVETNPKKEITLPKEMDEDFELEIEEPKIQKPTIEIIKPTKTIKATKINIPEKFILRDEGIELEEEEEPTFLNLEGDDGDKPKNIKKSKKRSTPAPNKEEIVLGPEPFVQIGDTNIESRLSAKEPNVDIVVSSYYMNNREIFINFINGLFQPYRQELMSEESNINCENIGRTDKKFSLLIHQKIVRDYLNLYTPYRGLLLYHGLGSGKTCTSIALAEGMKNDKKIIVMTPASLRRNYMEELKKCGDYLYKKNQFWEWISVDPIKENTDKIKTLSYVLNLPIEYIQKKKGAWLVNVKKESNYQSLDSEEKRRLDEQLDVMIENKYTFINYNGIRGDKLKAITNNYTTNLFDDCVVIIDEAHNFISRIVNKIQKEKEIPVNELGIRSSLPNSLSLKLYEFLMMAKNTKIVLLSGTPIINYPNEIGILYNILRGYIKTWSFEITTKSDKKMNEETIKSLFEREKSIDYIRFSPTTKILTVTKNPFGFENKIREKTGYEGVTNQTKKKNEKGENMVVLNESGLLSDDDFQKRIISKLKKNDIDITPSKIKITLNKNLPDKLDSFIEFFIDPKSGNVKNIELFKRRILGLTSYFRSAQEDLMPRYDKLTDYQVIDIPMSDYQFEIYEEARTQERKTEKFSKQNSGKPSAANKEGVYEDTSSTYRIFSRLYCNFVFPKPPGRPLPNEKDEKDKDISKTESKEIVDDLEKANKEEENVDLDNAREGEVEGDELLEKIGDEKYEQRLREAVTYVKDHASEILSPEALRTYSPKYLHMLDNIRDESHVGLHLVYSQFRTLEGIGIFSLVLDYNGFTRFKIKKNALGLWEMDISPENQGKPMYGLYTGTETAEEKEIIRNIFNSSWEYIPTTIADYLKDIASNNNMGEIIKVLMITASGSEGINLKNTRYVHIMEPYWHPVRIEQVIGRARRICSHQDLPEELQTINVFVYLMSLTQTQIDRSRELKKYDVSKRDLRTPLTSDQSLYEISMIKEEVSQQLLTAIKEASIDCAVHTKVGSKEVLRCMSFGNVTNKLFSSTPSILDEPKDITAAINKVVLEWRGKELTMNGKKYILKEGSTEVYDYDTYQQALINEGVQPIFLGRLEKKDGKFVFKKI